MSDGDNTRMGTHIIFDQICSKNLGGKNTKLTFTKEVQVDKDQEKAQSEKDSHSKNRDGKKLN